MRADMRVLNTLIHQNPRVRKYAVLDAALLGGLLEQLFLLGRSRYACLLPGNVEPDVAHVAPYLVALTPGMPLLDWIEERLGQPWGYLIESDQDGKTLQIHLRTFSEVRGPNGEALLFRFWDPRVLQSMTTILTPAQGGAFMQGLKRVRLIWGGQTSVTNVEWKAETVAFSVTAESIAAEE